MARDPMKVSKQPLTAKLLVVKLVLLVEHTIFGRRPQFFSNGRPPQFFSSNGRWTQFFFSNWRRCHFFPSNGRGLYGQMYFFCKWKTTSIFLQMENKLNIFLKEDNLFFFFKWKMTSFYSNGIWLYIFSS